LVTLNGNSKLVIPADLDQTPFAEFGSAPAPKAVGSASVKQGIQWSDQGTRAHPLLQKISSSQVAEHKVPILDGKL